MSKETQDFVKELEKLRDNLGIRAKSYFKIDGGESEAYKELHDHYHKLNQLIKRWKTIG